PATCYRGGVWDVWGGAAGQGGHVWRPAPAIIRAARPPPIAPPMAPPAAGNPARSASAATAATAAAMLSATNANLIMTSPCLNEIELLLLFALRARLDCSISNGQDMSRGLREADIRG